MGTVLITIAFVVGISCAGFLLWWALFSPQGH